MHPRLPQEDYSYYLLSGKSKKFHPKLIGTEKEEHRREVQEMQRKPQVHKQGKRGEVVKIAAEVRKRLFIQDKEAPPKTWRDERSGTYL